MPFKLDLHVHTASRGQIFITAPMLRMNLQERKLDGVAVTNFFNISHAQHLREELKEFVVIVGQEVWSKDGHIIGLGLHSRITDFLSAEETITQIHGQGGIVVAPHPSIEIGLGNQAWKLGVDAIEVYNGLMGRVFAYNFLASRMAEKYKIPAVAGTDTTDARYVGVSYTEVLTDEKTCVLETIRSGKVRVHKKPVPFPFAFIAKNLMGMRNLETCPLHATPCYVCGKSLVIRLVKRNYQCLDCGNVVPDRIICCNGHYVCKRCISKRGVETEVSF